MWQRCEQEKKMEEKEKARRKRINKVKSFAGRRKRRRRRSHAKKINKIPTAAESNSETAGIDSKNNSKANLFTGISAIDRTIIKNKYVLMNFISRGLFKCDLISLS